MNATDGRNQTEYCPPLHYGPSCALTGAREVPGLHYSLIAAPVVLAVYTQARSVGLVVRVLAFTRGRVPTNARRWGHALVKLSGRVGGLALLATLRVVEATIPQTGSAGTWSIVASAVNWTANALVVGLAAGRLRDIAEVERRLASRDEERKTALKLIDVAARWVPGTVMLSWGATSVIWQLDRNYMDPLTPHWSTWLAIQSLCNAVAFASGLALSWAFRLSFLSPVFGAKHEMRWWIRVSGGVCCVFVLLVLQNALGALNPKRSLLSTESQTSAYITEAVLERVVVCLLSVVTLIIEKSIRNEVDRQLPATTRDDPHRSLTALVGTIAGCVALFHLMRFAEGEGLMLAGLGGIILMTCGSFAVLFSSMGSAQLPRSIAMSRLAVELEKSRSGLVMASVVSMMDAVTVSGITAPDSGRESVANFDVIPEQGEVQRLLEQSLAALDGGAAWAAAVACVGVFVVYFGSGTLGLFIPRLVGRRWIQAGSVLALIYPSVIRVALRMISCTDGDASPPALPNTACGSDSQRALLVLSCSVIAFTLGGILLVVGVYNSDVYERSRYTIWSTFGRAMLGVMDGAAPQEAVLRNAAALVIGSSLLIASVAMLPNVGCPKMNYFRSVSMAVAVGTQIAALIRDGLGCASDPGKPEGTCRKGENLGIAIACTILPAAASVVYVRQRIAQEAVEFGILRSEQERLVRLFKDANEHALDELISVGEGNDDAAAGPRRRSVLAPAMLQPAAAVAALLRIRLPPASATPKRILAYCALYARASEIPGSTDTLRGPTRQLLIWMRGQRTVRTQPAQVMAQPTQVMTQPAGARWPMECCRKRCQKKAQGTGGADIAEEAHVAGGSGDELDAEDGAAKDGIVPSVKAGGQPGKSRPNFLASLWSRASKASAASKAAQKGPASLSVVVGLASRIAATKALAKAAESAVNAADLRAAQGEESALITTIGLSDERSEVSGSTPEGFALRAMCSTLFERIRLSRRLVAYCKGGGERRVQRLHAGVAYWVPVGSCVAMACVDVVVVRVVRGSTDGAAASEAWEAWEVEGLKRECSHEERPSKARATAQREKESGGAPGTSGGGASEEGSRRRRGQGSDEDVSASIREGVSTSGQDKEATEREICHDDGVTKSGLREQRGESATGVGEEGVDSLLPGMARRELSRSGSAGASKRLAVGSEVGQGGGGLGQGGVGRASDDRGVGARVVGGGGALDAGEDDDIRQCVACDARSVLVANPGAKIVVVTPQQLDGPERMGVERSVKAALPEGSQHPVLLAPQEAEEGSRWAGDFLAAHFFLHD